MKTVNEVCRLAGISPRTLHYYDQKGLLPPAEISPSGYRLYNEESLSRLRTILLFKELDFSLKEIKDILDNPSFDRREALLQQRELLRCRKKRIEKLIALAESMIEKGDYEMDFSAFDKTEAKRLAEEAKQKWGKTAAYAEYEKNTEGKTDMQMNEKEAALMRQFSEIGKFKDFAPESEEAQAAAESLRQFISKNFYNCTPEIFEGLGEVYIADDRFKANIDAAGGEGTAEFISRAIKAYCEK